MNTDCLKPSFDALRGAGVPAHLVEAYEASITNCIEQLGKPGYREARLHEGACWAAACSPSCVTEDMTEPVIWPLTGFVDALDAADETGEVAHLVAPQFVLLVRGGVRTKELHTIARAMAEANPAHQRAAIAKAEALIGQLFHKKRPLPEYALAAAEGLSASWHVTG